MRTSLGRIDSDPAGDGNSVVENGWIDVRGTDEIGNDGIMVDEVSVESILDIVAEEKGNPLETIVLDA